MMTIRMFPSVIFVLALAGCGGQVGGLFGGDDPAPAAVAAEEPSGDLAAGAPQAPDAEGVLRGLTVASLGDATRPGLWIETPVVTEEQPGRVIGPDGTVIALTLIPSGGARGSGSRLSLEAMQALGIPLTDLPTVTILSDA